VTLKKSVKLFVSVLIFLWIFLGIHEAQAAAPPEEWWDPLWLCRQKITIDTTQAQPGSSLTAFVIWIHPGTMLSKTP